jgi:hypothetical protein
VHEEIRTTLAPTHHLVDLIERGWNITEVVGGDVVELDDFVLGMPEVVNFGE